MAAYNHRDIFTITQIFQTTATILLLVLTVFISALAADYTNLWSIALLILLSISTIIAALPLINGKTATSLRLTLIPIVFTILIITLTQGPQFATAGDFIWQNIVLAWQSFTNKQ